jgi:hypothetical protein
VPSCEPCASPSLDPSLPNHTLFALPACRPHRAAAMPSPLFLLMSSRFGPLPRNYVAVSPNEMEPLAGARQDARACRRLST